MIQKEILMGPVFVAGFLSFSAPCTFPLIPVYIGLIIDESNEYKKIKVGKLEINIGAIIKTIAFVLGLSTSFVILGFGSGLFGNFITNKWVILLAGFLVFILGIHQMDIIHLNIFNKFNGIRIKNNKKKALGSYLMGISFLLGWTPCVDTVLAAVLVTSTSSGTQFYGALLMLIYSLGLMFPFLILAIASTIIMNKFKFFEKHLITIKRIGCFLVALMGIILMT